jgi:carbon monoxide dehydrogenase subunit G
MEVRLDKRFPIAASTEQCWAVLSSLHATAACMPGAQITEQLGPTQYRGTVKSKVGPAVMSFGGHVDVQAHDAVGRSLQMMAKGADKSGSSATMNLAAHIETGEHPGHSVLVGLATIVVSGKLAQFGSRLLVPVSDAMLAQFAGNFETAAKAVPPPGAAVNDSSPAAAARSPDAVRPPAAARAKELAGGFGSEATTTLMLQQGQMPGGHVPVPAAPVKELNALALLWTVVKGWFAGLFGSRRA